MEFNQTNTNVGTVNNNLTTEERKLMVGIGMPAALKLDEFASHVWAVFGGPPYLVGSALRGKVWRDVDVRVILCDAEYERWGFGDPAQSHRNAKWVALCLAFAELGQRMSGLPIDFQIQQQTWANAKNDGPRSALGVVAMRMSSE